MREGFERRKQQITPRELERAAAEYGHDPDARQTVWNWRAQEQDKRMAEQPIEARLRIHLDAAYALRSAHMISEARQELLSVAETARDFGQDAFLAEATEALEQLPTLH